MSRAFALALARFALLGLTLCLATLAQASTGYYLVKVYEVPDELSLDFRWWQARPSGRSPIGAPDYGIGYGVTRAWYTELYVGYLNRDKTGNVQKETVWQNDVLLTAGQLPFDLAVHTAVLYNRDRSRGTGVEVGPILETEFGRTHLNLGLLFERTYGGSANVQGPVQMKYQWALQHRFHPLVELGAMGFGELGDWKDWLPRDKQSHRAGPALSGRWEFTRGLTLKYDAAYLIGSISAVHMNALSARIQLVY